MHIFIMRDRGQPENLSKALDAVGARLQPDEAKRKVRAGYAATLRYAAGQEIVDILE
jgi:hypothetical protein